MDIGDGTREIVMELIREYMKGEIIIFIIFWI